MFDLKLSTVYFQLSKEVISIHHKKKGYIKLNIFRSLLILVFTISISLSAQSYNRQVPWATGKSKGSDLQIFLVEFSPGDNITDYFGHIAMVVKDTTNDVARVYNFGLFSFDEGFIKRFAMGRLIFWKAALSLSGTIRQYISMNRTITFYELNLRDDKKLILAKQLNWEVLPQNSQYLYHHYNDNCATRLRDLINIAVDDQFRKFTDKPARFTLREHTIRYTEQDPLMQWLLMFLMNDSIDEPVKQWAEMFLPGELVHFVKQFSYQDSSGVMQHLVTSSSVYYDSGREPVKNSADNWPLWTIFAGIFIAGLAVSLAIWSKKNTTKARVLFFAFNLFIAFVFGFIGTALFLMASFTDHIVTYYNENIFLANPLTFIIFFLSAFALFKPSKKIIGMIKWLWYFLAASSLLLLILKIFPAFNQDNFMIISLLLPVNCGFAFAFYKKDLSKS